MAVGACGFTSSTDTSVPFTTLFESSGFSFDPPGRVVIFVTLYDGTHSFAMIVSCFQGVLGVATRHSRIMFERLFFGTPQEPLFLKLSLVQCRPCLLKRLEAGFNGV